MLKKINKVSWGQEDSVGSNEVKGNQQARAVREQA